MIYEFGAFSFDEATRELRKGGRIVALEPQPAKALALLVARAGALVTREELAEQIWGGDTHVDFNRGLAYCLSQVRTALGDSGENPRFIQTLPKRGFKFVAPVLQVLDSRERADGPRQSAEAPRTKMPRTVRIALGIAAAALFVLGAVSMLDAIQRGKRPVVAVSIFDNETGDPAYDRPVHAMADTVVDRLTTFGPAKLGVIGNASVLRMPRNQRDLERIEDQTRASHVILAQLQPRNGELSLLIHLIRLDDGTHLWTRRVPRPAGDALVGLDNEAASLIESGVRQHVLIQD